MKPNSATPGRDLSLSFYTRVFGWDLLRDERFVKCWPVATDILEDADLPTAADFPFGSAIAVSSLDDSLYRIEREGGSVIGARLVVPGIGYLAYCQDGVGNPFGVFEPNDSAR